jgi:hypothetical protein
MWRSIGWSGAKGVVGAWAVLKVLDWVSEKFLDKVIPWLSGPEAIVPALLIGLLLAGFVWYGQRQTERERQRSSFELFKPAQKLQPEDLSLQPVTDDRPLGPGYRPYHSVYIKRIAVSRAKAADLPSALARGTGPATAFTEDELVAELRAGRSWLLIGKPTEGKSRTLFEVVRRMTDWIVVRPHKQTLPDPAAYALLDGLDVICLIDDLSDYVESRVDLVDFCKAAGHPARRFAIAAACRNGPELNALQNAYASPQRKLYEQFDHCLHLRPATNEEKQKLAAAVPSGGDPVVTTLGSICMRGAYATMKARFDGFDQRTRDCHAAIQLLVATGLTQISHARILRVWQAIWQRNDCTGALRDELERLRSNSFLVSEPGTDPVIPEMAYFASEEAHIFYRGGSAQPQTDVPQLFEVSFDARDFQVAHQIALEAALSATPWRILGLLGENAPAFG